MLSLTIFYFCGPRAVTNYFLNHKEFGDRTPSWNRKRWRSELCKNLKMVYAQETRINREKTIGKANRNSFYFKWVFLLKIFKRKMPLNLQGYLPLVSTSCIVDSTSCTVTESNIQVKSYRVHMTFSRKLKKTFTLKTDRINSLFVWKGASNTIEAFISHMTL